MHPVVAAIFAPAPFLTAGLGWLWLGLTEISRNVCRSIPLDDAAALR
jgi:hypothetical protein